MEYLLAKLVVKLKKTVVCLGFIDVIRLFRMKLEDIKCKIIL